MRKNVSRMIMVAMVAGISLAMSGSGSASTSTMVAISVKNNWDKTIEVYLYNGDDQTRWSTKDEFLVKSGETETGYCLGKGKGRCYVKIRKLRGDKSAENKFGGWQSHGTTCTVKATASGSNWGDDISCT